MGSKKISIKRIKDESKRQVTYSKRKHSVIRKAYEMSVLSDIAVGFISFSLAGRLCFFSGNQRIEEVFERYMNLPNSIEKYTPEERAHILEILNVIRLQSRLNSSQNAERKKVTSKQEELKMANDNLKEFEFEDVQSIKSLATIESREKILLGELQRVSQQKESLFQNDQSGSPSYQNNMIQNPTWLAGPSGIQTQATEGTMLQNPALVEGNWMPQDTINLNTPRPSLNLTYQGPRQTLDLNLPAQSDSPISSPWPEGTPTTEMASCPEGNKKGSTFFNFFEH